MWLSQHACYACHLQVWRTPSFEKQMSPMQLHRTYGQCHDDVLDLDWSPDSRFVAVASKDIVARVFSLSPQRVSYYINLILLFKVLVLKKIQKNIHACTKRAGGETAQSCIFPCPVLSVGCTFSSRFNTNPIPFILYMHTGIRALNTFLLNMHTHRDTSPRYWRATETGSSACSSAVKE